VGHQMGLNFPTVLGFTALFALAVAGFIHWISKFFPVPVPGAPAQSDPPGAYPNSLLSRVILAYNNGKSYFKLSPTWTVLVGGAANVIIHKVSITQANAIAALLTSLAGPNYPLQFLLACLAVESVLDPACQNANLAANESNAGAPQNLAGYDMGIAQLKLKYVMSATGLGVNQAMDFALDIKTAVPYHIQAMNALLLKADQILANPSSAADPRMNNRWMLATWMYNEGEEGAMAAYNAGEFPNHCASVLGDIQYFERSLGLQPMLPDLAA
jgi:hypothetical protein